ncbi:MAG: HAD family phosphatase [Bacteroidales bacterium]|nr:MAG: HAD family phosphatase [Bacteroidales bacterium]
MKVTTYIFDLGNVLFQADMSRAITHWQKVSKLSDADMTALILESDIHYQFERGHLSPECFFLHVRQILNTSAKYEYLISGWNSIYGDLISCNYQAIVEFKKLGRVVAFTNTNNTHLSVWKNKYINQLSVFDKIYSSCEIGHRKPDLQSFQFLLNDLNIKPGEAFFFDDKVENIKSAEHLGITSILVNDDQVLVSIINERKNMNV